jgi:hypothetical protein
MKSQYFLLAATVAAVNLHAQERMEPLQLRADFMLLRKTLETAHAGLYRYTPKRTMDARFEAAAKKLNHPMNPVEFRIVLGSLLSEIRCGHTRLGNDPALEQFLKDQPLFPFRLSLEDGRFYVVENQSSDQSIRPGAEIVTINGRSMKAIQSQLLPLFSGDGDILTGRLRHLARNFSVAYSTAIDPATTFKITLRDAAGMRTISISGVKRSEMQKNAESNPANTMMREASRKLEWSSGNAGLRFLRDPDVAQLRIGSFGGSDFPDLLEKHFRTIREKSAKALILDLRGNGGGADKLGALLVSYLVSAPFRYFDRIQMSTIDPPREHTYFPEDRRERLKSGTKPNPDGGFLVLPSTHPQLREQLPAKDPFRGRLIVLIDGGCFSTCADVAAVIHHLKRGTFIGEETGGGYYGNNSGINLALTLPNSKLPVSIPMWEYWNAVPGYPHTRRGTIPDHRVLARVANYLAGRDTALEAALSRID